MSAEAEKRMAGNYEITQALRIGDREVVFGIDPASDKPYFCALYQKIFEIIQFREWYEKCFASDNFVEVAEQFAAYVQEQCQKVREEWAKVAVPRIRITEEMCFSQDYRNPCPWRKNPRQMNPRRVSQTRRTKQRQNMCKQKVSIGCAICKGRSESAGKQSIARFRRERSKPCWSARNT